MTINFGNFGSKLSEINQIGNGGEATFRGLMTAGKESLDYQNTLLGLKDTSAGFKFVSGEIAENGLSGGLKSVFSKSSTKFLQEGIGNGAIDYHKHVFWGNTEKFAPKMLQAFDKSLLETGVGRNILAKFGGSIVKDTTTGAIKSVSGGTAANIAGKTMAKIPILGIVISAGLEVPDILDAFKNGDGVAQIGRSAVNVACTTVCAAALGAILAPIPGGAILGAIVGGWIGSKLGKFLGRALFGKSIKDKMKDGDMAKEALQKWQTLSSSSLSSVYNVSGSSTKTSGKLDLQKGADYLNTLNANLAHINSV